MVKTQSRRILNPQPPGGTTAVVDLGGLWSCVGNNGPNLDVRGAVGDRIWCKERWLSWISRTPEEEALVQVELGRFWSEPSLEGMMVWSDRMRDIGRTGPEEYMYAQDFGKWADDPDSDLSWVSSRFMPKKAARIWLEVTGVRVQRLHEITDEDALAEGVTHYTCGHPDCFGPDGEPGRHYGPRGAFMESWDKLNARRGPWESNPWVRALTFKRIP